MTQEHAKEWQKKEETIKSSLIFKWKSRGANEKDDMQKKPWLRAVLESWPQTQHLGRTGWLSHGSVVMLHQEGFLRGKAGYVGCVVVFSIAGPAQAGSLTMSHRHLARSTQHHPTAMVWKREVEIQATVFTNVLAPLCLSSCPVIPHSAVTVLKSRMLIWNQKY